MSAPVMPLAYATGICATHVRAADARTNERTDVDDYSPCEDILLLSNAGASNGLIYIVEWPAHDFVKVGYSGDSRRWLPFLRRGGVLRHVHAPTDRHASVIESALHKAIRSVDISPAFTCKADAEPFLGNKGAGWTECYRVGEGKFAQLIAIDELAARRRGA